LFGLRIHAWWFVFTVSLFAPERLHAHGDLHERIERVSREIQAAPENPRLYAKRAELYREHREFSDALKDVQKARSLNDLAEFQYLHALILFEAGRGAEALPVLNKLLADDPKHVGALLIRARIRVASGESDNANSDYASTLELMDSPDPDFFLEYARSLAHAGKASHALEILEGANRRIGNVPAFDLLAADLYVACKNYDAALARIDRLQKQAPQTELRVRRAEILRLAGRRDEAERELKDAAVELKQSRRRNVDELAKHIENELKALTERKIP
jgi:predicted Zn-dependent protease